MSVGYAASAAAKGIELEKLETGFAATVTGCEGRIDPRDRRRRAPAYPRDPWPARSPGAKSDANFLSYKACAWYLYTIG
jgi:hypothetical protein